MPGTIFKNWLVTLSSGYRHQAYKLCLLNLKNFKKFISKHFDTCHLGKLQNLILLALIPKAST